LECSVEFDGKDLAISRDGVKVAIRESAAWVVIEPGWEVEEDKGKNPAHTYRRQRHGDGIRDSG
jgi:hypothetical protein